MRDERRPAGLSDFWSRSWCGAARCGREHHLCMGAVLRSLALSRSEGRACTRELLSLPLEICYSTTFLLQSPSSSFLELGGQHPTECPSLSEQPPKDRMQIYSSLITQIHKSFPNRGNYPDGASLKKWLKPHFDPEISSDFLKIFVRKKFLIKKSMMYIDI